MNLSKACIRPYFIINEAVLDTYSTNDADYFSSACQYVTSYIEQPQNVAYDKSDRCVHLVFDQVFVYLPGRLFSDDSFSQLLVSCQWILKSILNCCQFPLLFSNARLQLKYRNRLTVDILNMNRIYLVITRACQKNRIKGVGLTKLYPRSSHFYEVDLLVKCLLNLNKQATVQSVCPFVARHL